MSRAHCNIGHDRQGSTNKGYREIVTSDIGQPWIEAFGCTWLVEDFLGRVLSRDVGKRIYIRGDILQTENDEQRDKRIA